MPTNRMYWDPLQSEPLPKGAVFVFGSNLAGIHGAGSAKAARGYGAKSGIGEGRQGRSYAIPTKGYHLGILTLHAISCYVDEFLRYAAEAQDEKFYVVAIGCGYAKYMPSEIAPLFRNSPSNVVLPTEFKEVLEST